MEVKPKILMHRGLQIQQDLLQLVALSFVEYNHSIDSVAGKPHISLQISKKVAMIPSPRLYWPVPRAFLQLARVCFISEAIQFYVKALPGC